MKNWKYIDGANIGNSGSHLDSAGARQVRELAAKYWHSGIHDTRNLAMTVAWEWAKRSGVARETTQDLVSEIQNVIDRWIKEIKTGNAKIKYTDKRDSKKEYLIDEVSGDLEVWVDGRKVDSLKNAGEGWKKYVETHATKTGKVGNETMREWATSKPKSVGNADIVKDGNVWVVLYAEGTKSKEFDSEAEAKRFAAHVGNSDREFFKKLADDAKEREDKDKQEVEKLVGNETYQHKLYPDKYVIIEGKNYKIVTDGKVEKSGELTDAVLYGINQTYKRVGNVASEYEILKQDPSKMHPMYKKAYEEAMKKLAREDEEFKKRFEKEYGVKAKNEASDDKFAYVMREFDEGKLKTPDGKVVTDPAQAKAIAYSESKKAENGLARARNAMAGNWNSDRNISPVGAYKEFITNLKNAIELGVAAVTYNIDGSTLKTWVEQAKKEGYGSHISGVQGQKVILK